LSVARAIGKKAPIILFDEASSHFDPESDAYLSKIIRDELSDNTVVMVTHRYDNLGNFSKIYKIIEGELIECNVNEIKKGMA